MNKIITKILIIILMAIMTFAIVFLLFKNKTLNDKLEIQRKQIESYQEKETSYDYYDSDDFVDTLNDLNDLQDAVDNYNYYY